MITVVLRAIFCRAGLRTLLTGLVFALGPVTHSLAEDLFVGLVTKVYRANAKIGVQLQQNGGAAGPIIDFDVLDGLPFDEVEPGDHLRFTAEQIGGVWTITRFQRQ
jgi:hypothetical protein